MTIAYGHSHWQYTARDFNRPNTIPSPPSTNTRDQATFAPNFRGASGKHNPSGPSPSHALSTDSRLSESTDRATSPSLNGNATYGGPAQNTLRSSLATGRNGMEIGLHKVAQRQQSYSDESPQTSLGIAVYFSKKPNDISTGKTMRVLPGARNATTPKEPQ